jgi:partitioning defective protein 6
MMVANSSNLIITVKPANQQRPYQALAPRRGSFSRTSQLSSGSAQSAQSAATESDTDPYDQDEIVDLTVGLNEDDQAEELPNKVEAVLHL